MDAQRSRDECVSLTPMGALLDERAAGSLRDSALQRGGESFVVPADPGGLP
jgi:hypothetical protein